MAKGIQIDIFGHKATIAELLASRSSLSVYGKKKFIVLVEFGKEHPWGIISQYVHVPAKNYSKEEFAETVTRETEKAINKHLGEKEKGEKFKVELKKLEDLAKRVSKEVGLEAK